MALTAGEVEILLKAKDEASAAIDRVESSIKKLAPGAEKASSATNLLDSSFAKLTASFSVASLIDKGVSALVSYGVAAVRSASEITDLASKTGLTTAEIQRMGFVAAQTSSSMESFTNASYKLGQNIAGGSGSVNHALKELGLELEKVQGLSAGDQFDVVTAALGRMQNETERNRVGQELFGNTFKGIASAVGQGYDMLKEKAIVASDAQVKAVAEAQNAWEGFKKNLTTAILSELGNAMLFLTAEQKKAMEQFRASSAAGQEYKGTLDDLSEAQQKQLKAAMGSIAAESKLNVTIDTGSLSRRDYVEELGKLRSELAAIKPATLAQIDAQLELGYSTEKVAKEFNLTTQKVDLLKTQFAEQKRRTEELSAAMGELDSSGQTWRQTVADLDSAMVKSVKTYLEAGVSQGALATAYNVTASSIAAIAKSLEVEKKLNMEVGKLWAEYAEVRVQAGGTATQKAIADVQRWGTEVTLRMKQAGADTHIFYDALANVSKAKIDASLIDWDRLSTVSKKHLEDVALRARATYEQMVGDSGNYGAAAIETQRQVAEAAKDAARNYRDANFEAMEEVIKKAEETSKQVAAFMNAPTLNQRASESYSMDVKPMTSTELKNLNAQHDPFNQGGDVGIWKRLQLLEDKEGTYAPKSFKQYSTMLRENLELARLRMWSEGKQRPPGFKGGVNRFVGGRAIVGEEGPEILDLPTGSSVTPMGRGGYGGGGGGTTVVISPGAIVVQGMLDSPAVVQRFAAQVKAALVADDRARGRTMGRA